MQASKWERRDVRRGLALGAAAGAPLLGAVPALADTHQVRSYPVRILGDATSAVVFFVESAGAFGPAEIRATATVNSDTD